MVKMVSYIYLKWLEIRVDRASHPRNGQKSAKRCFQLLSASLPELQCTLERRSHCGTYLQTVYDSRSGEILQQGPSINTIVRDECHTEGHSSQNMIRSAEQLFTVANEGIRLTKGT